MGTIGKKELLNCVCLLWWGSWLQSLEMAQGKRRKLIMLTVNIRGDDASRLPSNMQLTKEGSFISGLQSALSLWSLC